MVNLQKSHLYKWQCSLHISHVYGARAFIPVYLPCSGYKMSGRMFIRLCSGSRTKKNQFLRVFSCFRIETNRIFKCFYLLERRKQNCVGYIYVIVFVLFCCCISPKCTGGEQLACTNVNITFTYYVGRILLIKYFLCVPQNFFPDSHPECGIR